MDWRILIVDDEPDMVDLVRIWLKGAGYLRVDSAGTGHEALAIARDNPPDCILLDIVLPDQSGLEVCRILRSLPALSRTPVVLFTCHKREKVLGLQNGADYFVAKSEKPHELLATLDAIFRRRQMEEGMLSRGDLVLKSQERKVYWKGQEVATLTPKMFVLLHVLVERSPEPMSRDDLYRLVAGQENRGLSRALEVLLNRLRRSLPEELARRIVSARNFGYFYVER